MRAVSSNDYLINIDKHPTAVFVLHEKTERRFPVHKHVKGQLTYVQGGIAYVHVAGKIYVIPSRHYIWIPSGLPHFLQVKNPGATIRTLYFPVEAAAAEFYGKMGIYPVSDLLHEMLLYTEKFHGEIEDGNAHFCFFAAIKNILPELGVTHLQTALPTSQHERLRPVLTYLADHVSEQITLHNIAEQFGFSERTISRLFQSELSISFLQYVKQLRMVKAVEFMLQTDLTLSEIAYATGYLSISAFSNTFYQFTNMRPSQFTQTVR
jgi:AraC-like DNA-binding protein/mannose-6-phosphate isomerase-like protein (cupin superfamily)